MLNRKDRQTLRQCGASYDQTCNSVLVVARDAGELAEAKSDGAPSDVAGLQESLKNMASVMEEFVRTSRLAFRAMAAAADGDRAAMHRRLRRLGDLGDKKGG